MLKYGQEYVDKGIQYYDEKYRQQQIQLLKKKAAKLGFHMVKPKPLDRPAEKVSGERQLGGICTRCGYLV
jgi:transposase